jgi:replicative DNA helicase
MAESEYVDLDAERYVLGAMMISPKAVAMAMEELEPEDFYYMSHGAVFETMRRMFVAGEPIELITLWDAISKNSTVKITRAKLAEIAYIVPAAGNAAHYARIVREKAELRAMARMLTERLRNLAEGGSHEQLVALDASLLDLHEQLERGHNGTVSAAVGAEYLRSKIENPLPEETGVEPPWSFLPRLIGGRLYVLGGYQADGKTAAACHFVHKAAQGGHRVAFVSMEMRWQDVMDRLLSILGVIPASLIARGNILSEHQGPAAVATSSMDSWQVDIIDDPHATTTAIRRYQKLGRYDFIVIDHLHRFATRAEYRRMDIEQIVQDLVNLARTEEIPVLLLAQLRRSTGGKPYPRPTLADIRETAMIEAEAAVVWFLWRERDEKNLPTNDCEWITAKNRYGKTGDRKMFFDDTTLRLSQVDNWRDDL